MKESVEVVKVVTVRARLAAVEDRFRLTNGKEGWAGDGREGASADERRPASGSP